MKSYQKIESVMQKKTDIEHGQLQTDQYKQIVRFDIKKKISSPIWQSLYYEVHWKIDWLLYHPVYNRECRDLRHRNYLEML